MKISRINIIDYILGFEGLRDSLSDFYIRSAPSECAIFGAYGGEDDKNAVGLLILRTDANTFPTVIFTSSKDNDPDIVRGLIEGVEAFCKGELSSFALAWRFTEREDGDSSGFGITLGNSLGFYPADTAHIFRANVKDIEKASPSLFGALSPVSSRFGKRGYEVKSFSELASEETEVIMRDPRGEFSLSSYLEPDRIIKSGNGKFCPDLSFAAVRSGCPVSYCLTSAQNQENCTLEILASADRYAGCGVSAMMIKEFVGGIIRSRFITASAAIYDRNTYAVGLLRKLAKDIPLSEKKQYIFLKNL